MIHENYINAVVSKNSRRRKLSKDEQLLEMDELSTFADRLCDGDIFRSISELEYKVDRVGADLGTAYMIKTTQSVNQMNVFMINGAFQAKFPKPLANGLGLKTLEQNLIDTHCSDESSGSESSDSESESESSSGSNDESLC